MRRTTTLVAWVAVLGWVGAPLAALAAEHEQGGKAGEHSNAQWSEDAAKGQERAAEAKAGAKVAPSKAEADAKRAAAQRLSAADGQRALRRGVEVQRLDVDRRRSRLGMCSGG